MDVPRMLARGAKEKLGREHDEGVEPRCWPNGRCLEGFLMPRLISAQCAHLGLNYVLPRGRRMENGKLEENKKDKKRERE